MFVKEYYEYIVSHKTGSSKSIEEMKKILDLGDISISKDDSYYIDDCGNIYVWTTAAKSWPEGAVKNVRGTIKDHRTYKNTKQTILKNCREI